MKGICAHVSTELQLVEVRPRTPGGVRPREAPRALRAPDGRRPKPPIGDRQGKSEFAIALLDRACALPAKFVGTPKIWHCRNLIGPLSIRNRRQVLGADVGSKPPDHQVSAILGWTVAGKRQHELVRDFASKGIQPDATVRHVGNQAVFRRPAFGRPEFCQTFDRVARRLALVIELFGLWRRHARAPVDHFRSNEAWTPCDRPNGRARIFRSFGEISGVPNLRGVCVAVICSPRMTDTTQRSKGAGNEEFQRCNAGHGEIAGRTE